MKAALVLFPCLAAAVSPAVLEARQSTTLCKKYEYWSSK
jgi:hypothetical protein